MRRHNIVSIFALAVLVVLATMVWISDMLIALDHRELKARQQALLEENSRLALWRIDSALAPIISQENARPYFCYSPFYPIQRAYTRMFNEINPGEVLMPSPLLVQNFPEILLYFQFAPNGKLTSPQVPFSNMRDLAESRYVKGDKIEAALKSLKRLSKRLDRNQLQRLVPCDKGHPAPKPTSLLHNFAPPKLYQQQQLRNAMEWQARSKSYYQNAKQNKLANSLLQVPASVQEQRMHPVWIGEMLVLARRVVVNNRIYLQGCWLDWPRLRRQSLQAVSDLLPKATLHPINVRPLDGRIRMLATLPVRLEPGRIPAVVVPGPNPLSLSLLAAWFFMTLAVLAVAILLVGLVALSERRGNFVSAVTHELRTPLTTFRMYTEMLEEGMVSGEEKRRQYLSILRSEAERLGHLVENVLAYARLDGKRLRCQLKKLPLNNLLARLESRLHQRAQQAGLELAVILVEKENGNHALYTDSEAVEQILFNLIDNACKYGASSHQPALELTVGITDRACYFRVRDYGPGVSPQDIRRLFQPFCKSASDAANSAPGVGLGLALSRRLARQLGGRLYLDRQVKPGACLVLNLPLK